jgi:hypothetical protein
MNRSPQRMQLSHRQGFKLQAASQAANGLACVKVDRSTRWGNPFRVGKDGVANAAVAVQLFRKLLEDKRVVPSNEHFPFTPDRLRADLGGLNLACWCEIGTPCHADVLLEIANAPNNG